MIQETINAALDQDYPETEVVVVDNYSTDNTWEMIQQIATKEPRVRAFRNEQNLGPVRNWIECAKQAKGHFSKILWSDDLIDPSFLSQTLIHMEDENVGFVYSGAQYFTSKRNSDSIIFHREVLQQIYPSEIFIEGLTLGKDLPVSPGCAVFRTADLRRNLLLKIPNSIGSDFSKHGIGPDLLLMLLTAKNYKTVAFVDKPISQFRHHTGSISVSTDLGRLLLLYDIAKAYFIKTELENSKLQRKFNALLLTHIFQYDGKKLGLRKVSDFYQSQTCNKIDVRFLLMHIARGLGRKFSHAILSTRLAR